MDSSMGKIDTDDGRKRPNESSDTDVPRKKLKDDHHSADLGDEGKGKYVVVVSGSDSTGYDPLKKTIDLGNITTTGSSMDQVVINQEISQVDDSFKERKKVQKFLIVPADYYASSKKEAEDDSSQKLNDLKTKDCIVGTVLGADGKAKYVIVPDSDSTREDPELKSLGNLGNITGSSMELERQDSQPMNQDISRLDDSLEELVGKMKSMIIVWKDLNATSNQQNLPDVCSKKETDDSKKKMNELNMEYPEILEHINSVLGVFGSLEDGNDVNLPSADETAAEGKSKDVVVSEESQELKKQSNDHDVNGDAGKTKESNASDDLLDIQEDLLMRGCEENPEQNLVGYFSHSTNNRRPWHGS